MFISQTICEEPSLKGVESGHQGIHICCGSVRVLWCVQDAQQNAMMITTKWSKSVLVVLCDNTKSKNETLKQVLTRNYTTKHIAHHPSNWDSSGKPESHLLPLPPLLNHINTHLHSTAARECISPSKRTPPIFRDSTQLATCNQRLNCVLSRNGSMVPVCLCLCVKFRIVV